MTIAFREAVGHYYGAPSATDPNTITASIPATVQTDDALLLAFCIGSGSDVPTTPTGWTAVDHEAGTTNGQMYLYRRTALAGDAGDPINITYTNPDATRVGTIVAAWSGVSTVTPVAAETMIHETVSTATHVTGSVAFASVPTVMVEFVMDRGPANTSWTVPGGSTKRADFYGTAGTDISAVCATTVINSTGSHGAQSYVSTSAAPNAMMATIAFTPVASLAQTASPDIDVTTTNWSHVGGTSFADAIGELVEDDTTYVQSPANDNGTDTFEVKLVGNGGTLSAPSDLTGVVLSVAMATQSASSVSAVIKVMQGATTIATFTETGITSTPQLFSYALNSTQAGNVTDWNDLRLRINVTVS